MGPTIPPPPPSLTVEPIGGRPDIRHQPRRRKRTLALTAGAIVAILVVLLLLAPDLPSGIPWGWHTSCGVGRAVGQVMTDTPSGGFDTPLFGRASFNDTWMAWAFRSGGLEDVSSVQFFPGFLGEGLGPQDWPNANGSVSLDVYKWVNWTIYETENVSSWGSGANIPCTAPFVADTAITQAQPNFITDVLQLPGASSDRNVSTNLNWSAGLVDMNFHSPNSPSINTCGDSTVSEANPFIVRIAASVTIPFGIPFILDGVHHVVWGELEWGSTVSYGPTIVYEFASQGIWQVDSSNSGGPGFYAFDHHACP